MKTIAELEALNVANSGCWFAPGSMRFFGTKIESGILQERYFITSEQPPSGPRVFTVRQFNEEGEIDTFGEFGGYRTKVEAKADIPIGELPVRIERPAN